MKEWPLWARQGGVEVIDEPNMVHSADGGGGSWDQVGRKLRVRQNSRQKTIENAMRHKAVDAMAVQKQQVDVNLSVEVNRRLSAALEREAALKVYEVKAEEA